MFQITDRAAQHLKAALSRAEETESALFRIRVAGNEVQLVVDCQRPGDTTIEHEGEALVVLDPNAVNLLHNRELDFQEAASGLVLKGTG